MVRQRSDASLLAPAHLMAVLYAEDPPMREANMPGGLPAPSLLSLCGHALLSPASVLL